MRRMLSATGTSLRQAAANIGIAAGLLCMPGVVYADGAIIRDILGGITNAVAPLWIPIGIMIVVIAGMTMLLTSKEEGLAKGRNTVMAVIIGGIIIMLGPFFVGIMYQQPGTEVENVASQLNIELFGIVGWLSAMGGVFAILMIVVAAAKAVSSFGGDEAAYAGVRNALLNAVFGLIIMAASIIIHDTVFQGSPNPIIQLILEKILIVLQIITTIAVGILVYAGFRMVTNFGNEEFFNQAKSLVYRVLMGLVVILVSYVAVFFTANAFS